MILRRVKPKEAEKMVKWMHDPEIICIKEMAIILWSGIAF